VEWEKAWGNMVRVNWTFGKKGQTSDGMMEAKIWAEFVGTDGIVVRREILVIQRNVRRRLTRIPFGERASD
jgi:hypothetical protein